MTEPNNTPILKPEIVAPPSVSNLSVAQVGTGMFSVTMQVIMVVRFPTDIPAGTPVVINRDHAVSPTPAITSTTVQAATGELKLMYVRPAYRGRGIARHLMAALEELAFQQGYDMICLETGTYLPAAIGLYTSCGYEPIPVYGEYVDNPYSVCFAKRLPVAA